MGFYPGINRGVVDNNGKTDSDNSIYIPELSEYLSRMKTKDEALDKGILLNAKRFSEEEIHMQ
jgi:hypothetical protein